MYISYNNLKKLGLYNLKILYKIVFKQEPPEVGSAHLATTLKEKVYNPKIFTNVTNGDYVMDYSGDIFQVTSRPRGENTRMICIHSGSMVMATIPCLKLPRIFNSDSFDFRKLNTVSIAALLRNTRLHLDDGDILYTVLIPIQDPELLDYVAKKSQENG